MYIKNNGKEFLTIESTKYDVKFIIDCLTLGIQNLPLENEDRTRYINFINHLKETIES